MHSRLLASLLVAVSLLACRSARTQDPPPAALLAGEHGDLAATVIFVLREDAIWCCDGSGDAARRWSPAGQSIAKPLELAPDGRTFALPQRELLLLTADGKTRSLGAFDGYGSRPCWLADGSALAFGTTAQAAGDGGVWISDDVPGNAHARRLTSTDHYEAEPTFSPDGSFVAVAACIDQAIERSHDVLYVRRQSRIEVVDRASGKRTVADDCRSEIFALAWSPDGRHLAAERDGELVALPMAGSAAGPVRRLAPTIRNGLPFCWTPDGRSVLAARRAAVQRDGKASPEELLIAPIDGEARTIPFGSEIYDAAAAPRGGYAAVTTGDGNLVRVDLATGECVPLLRDCDPWSPVWWRSLPAPK